MVARLLIIVAAALAASPWLPRVTHSTTAPVSACDSQTQFRSGQRVETSAVVERVLKDDTSGSRHQRFIVKLPSGQTLLIAHNIDIAPRVEGIARGDTISFSGIYEPNDKGGVVHWTHHDPSGRHAPGWIEHRGHRYQ